MNTQAKIFSTYTTKTIPMLEHELDTSVQQGLDPDKVKQRRKTFGFNEILSNKTGWLDIFVRQFKSPFIYLLLGAALLYFMLANHFDAMVILCVVVVNSLLGFFQEYRAHVVLKGLQQYMISYVTVVRSGQEVELPSRDLVPGDLVILYPGDVIPADIRFVQGQGITVDESELTGESVPVKKIGSCLDKEANDTFDAHNIGFWGTTIMSGKAVGIVFATGSKTTLGDIAQLATQTTRVSSFEKNISLLSRFIIRLMVISLVVIVGASLVTKAGSINITELIMFASALAITIIPEALPVVMTFALSQGALHLARCKVVVKRLSAIEDLGNVEILCTDKTGTLTENSLLVEAVYGQTPRESLVYGLLSVSATKKKMLHNKGFDAALNDALTPQEQTRVASYHHIAEIPFDPLRLRNVALVHCDGHHELIVRGTPEGVVPTCVGIDEAEKEKIQDWIVQQGTQGRRVLAVAKKEVQPPTSSSYDLDALEHDLHLIGLVAFGDPLKQTAIVAIAKARQLGVEIKILSGDTPEVCGSVAKRVGLIDEVNQVVTGQQLAALSGEQQEALIKKTAIFARVSPQQKYDIIMMLQKEKEVAYMGDGINDAPALKVANVALAVQEAVGIAREASDIILLKKSLMVIIDGIEEGRRIFANTLKYVRSTFAATFGNFYSLALASLVLDYLPMLPVQLLLTNLLCDLPMLSIATDTVNVSELKRPSKYNMRSIIILATLLGIEGSIFDLIFFKWFFHVSPALLQTSWFIESVIMGLVFIFSIRTTNLFFRASMPSWPLLCCTVVVGAITMMLPYTAFGQRVFSFVPIPTQYLIWIAWLVVAYFIITDVIKVLYYRWSNHTSAHT